MYQSGESFHFPGRKFDYTVIGAVCRLYDREELPYPSCKILWRGKQPYWNRVGRRFIEDMATRNSPSYNVTSEHGECVVTQYYLKLEQPLQAWWHTTTRKAELYVSQIQVRDGFA